MPHYKDGTLATIGDVVHGKGYNVPYEITGVVVAIDPAHENCNVMVAHASARKVGYGNIVERIIPVLDIEYGETAAFEKVA